MKILLHTHWGIEKNFIGGTERFILDLAKGIKARGDVPFIVCSNLEELIFIEGIPIYGIVPKTFKEKIEVFGSANENFFKEKIVKEKVTKKSLKRFSQYVFSQIKNFDFDIAHLNSFFYSALLPGSLPFEKMIVTNHENDKELENYWGSNAFSELKKICQEENSLKKFRERIVPSKYYAKFFSDTLAMQVSSIHLGINAGLSLKDRKKNKFKGNNSKKKEIIILQPSRFDMKQKGHDITIKALSILKKKKINFKCVFSGYDEDTYSKNIHYFNKLIKKYNLENNVFLRRFDHILDGFSICDIVVSPERFCSYGLAISESLAVGLPTILSPIPTYLEIASGYKHAYFCKNLSPDELAKTVLQVIDSKKMSINTEEASRFRQENSFEKCVDKYYKIYNQISE